MGYRYGALFDMDGVLVDNADFHIKAFQEWCNEKGIPFDEDFFRSKLFGKQNSDIFRALTGRDIPPDEIEKEGNYKEQIYRHLYKGNIRPIDGLLEFLQSLKSEGFGIALATSGPPENVDLTLGEIGAKNLFDAIVTCEDTPKGKPDPEVFLIAAEKLGLQPEKCAVFEDSPAGAEAAHAAGMALIGIATEHLQLENAALMTKDYRSITPEDIINAIVSNELSSAKCE